jgi:hypothetical protein
MTRKEKMYQQITQHGKNLIGVFGLSDTDPVKLCKQLYRLEAKAHQLATDYCNGENGVDSENWEVLTDKILGKVDKILGFRVLNIPVFVNGDARGYALKIKDDYIRENDLTIYTDWGGYGILAPDFERLALLQ